MLAFLLVVISTSRLNMQLSILISEMRLYVVSKEALTL